MRSERRRGFTLLEVLAAVAILAIAYSQLGASGIQGLQHEGEARRRIEASLLADSAVTEIESSIEAGTVPPVGEDEREQGAYRIKVAVDPYTLAVPDEEEKEGHRIGQAKSRLGGDAGAAPPPAAGPSLLGGDRGAVSPLRRIVVSVAWDEGFGERITTRVTYALDAEAAAGTLGALAEGAAAAQQQQQQAQPGGQPQGQPLEQGRQ
jgi:prepilin-type N-terminal cleavage/methylation domain-containing protein